MDKQYEGSKDESVLGLTRGVPAADARSRVGRVTGARVVVVPVEKEQERSEVRDEYAQSVVQVFDPVTSQWIRREIR
jgi:hypothetical protein